MIKIESLYRSYFQKSRIFLYPALDISMIKGIAPIKTYLSCKELNINYHHRKLICLYHIRKDAQFGIFEKVKLRGNRLFDRFLEVESTDDQRQGVYIFDYTPYTQDWGHFLKGHYSKLCPELKRKIKIHFRPDGDKYVYVESFIHPERYYNIYSELLGVSVPVLRDAIELTDKPDFEKECLRVQIKPLIKSKL